MVAHEIREFLEQSAPFATPLWESRFDACYKSRKIQSNTSSVRGLSPLSASCIPVLYPQAKHSHHPNNQAISHPLSPCPSPRHLLVPGPVHIGVSRRSLSPLHTILLLLRLHPPPCRLEPPRQLLHLLRKPRSPLTSTPMRPFLRTLPLKPNRNNY